MARQILVRWPERPLAEATQSGQGIGGVEMPLIECLQVCSRCAPYLIQGPHPNAVPESFITV
jgi:hypothetical protein